MTYEEAKAACLTAEDALYGDQLYPILPFVQVSSLSYIRTYIVVWDTPLDRWADLYACPTDSVEKMRSEWERSFEPANRFSWHRLVYDARDSKNWQALSLEDLIKLNRNDWIDIPHCRNGT